MCASTPPSFSSFLPSFFLIPHSSLRSVTLGVALGGNQAFSFHSWHQIRPTRTTQGCNTWCKRGYNAPSPGNTRTFSSTRILWGAVGRGSDVRAPPTEWLTVIQTPVYGLCNARGGRWWVLAEVSAIRHTKGPFWLTMGVTTKRRTAYPHALRRAQKTRTPK